ncbi:MAG: SufE family protein [Phycisphaerales bacterium]|nr:SufE family protein [Phycisphaerales bacterium]
MSGQSYGAPVTLEHMLEAFGFLDDWEDRYRFILDLGQKLPEMPESEKTEANFVHGCQSQVWVSLHETDGPGSPVAFLADSDAFIVKGLAAMVVTMLAGRPAAEIVSHDIESAFNQLGLHEHLSPTRSNALHGMVEQVKRKAVELAGAG